MKVSIIVVSYNTREMLRECLDSVYGNETVHELEVIVVDNISRDGSVNMIRENFPQVVLIENTWNAGFAAGVNLGYTRARGKYVFLLNPDARLKSNAIERAVTFMKNHPQCGICGARLLNPRGGLEPSARRFPGALNKLLVISGLSARYPHSRFFGRGDYLYRDHRQVMEVDWVPGTFSAIRGSLLEQLGFFDERFYLYYEETDLCLRAKRAGWKIFFIPNVEVVHEGGGSSKTREDMEFDAGAAQLVKFRMRSELLYFRKNYGLPAMLANAGVEIGWLLLRALVNLRHGKEHEQKRRSSLRAVEHYRRALRDTRWGSFTPPTPW